MPAVFGNIYAPPGVYTETKFERPLTVNVAALKIPVLIGTGNESLFRSDLELVRGSSSSVDQRVVQENMAGRFVVDITDAGQVILGEADGTRNRIQVRNFPIVNGQGTGTTTNDRAAVSVRIDGEPVVVLAVDGANGVITLTQAVPVDAVVDTTYFFNRTDTLFTDDVSDQVSSGSAEIEGGIGVESGGTFTITADLTDELILTVDEEAEHTITLTAGDFTPSQIAALINGQPTGSLNVAVFENSEGKFAIRLTADNDITIGDGSANSVLGFTAGQATARHRTFFVFQRPIVDGTNGGIITTDPADVTVRVDNVLTLASSVDGANGAVTLPYAPGDGAAVSIQYHSNTWENTFDYLEHRGVTEVLQAGVTPGRRDFIQGVDFILQDDKILWGTASTVEGGAASAGSVGFGPNQISTTLVDYKSYLSLATPVVDTSVSPAVDSRREFQISLQPTTGNGRNSPLGTETFQSVANDRIDLPTNRPDLVTAYRGYNAQDAIDRGPVEVVKVDSATSTITLKDQISPGEQVWVTHYYNQLQDQEYTITAQIPGPAGVGTYTIQDAQGSSLFGGRFTSKSASLTGITVQFPRGSELLPDLRFESGTGGPVEEVVTVEFLTTQDSPAKYSTPGPGPYFITDGASDRARLKIDAVDIASATGIDVSDPSGTGSGFFASLLGDEVIYDADSGGTTYEIGTADAGVSFTVDGVLISGTAATGTQSLQAYVDAINTGALAEGVEYRGATRFNGPLTVAAGEYDKLSFQYTGDLSSLSGVQTITLDPGVYATANAIATQINTKISALAAPTAADLTVTVGAPVDTNTITIDGDVLTGVAGVPAADEFNVDAAAQATLDVTIPGIVGPTNGDVFTLDDGTATPPTLTANTTGGVLGADEFDARPQAASEGTATVASSPNTPGTVVTVGATGFVATNGAVTPGDATYQADAGSTDAIAASLASQINAHPAASLVVSAADVGSVVTITALTPGVAGDTIVLTSSLAGDVAVSGSGTLEGGRDADEAAASFAAILNGSPSFTGLASAVAVGTTVTITADLTNWRGDAGNALIGETTNVTEIALPGAGATASFTGGEDHPAKKIADAINASSNFTGVTAAYVIPDQFTLTAVVPGTVGNSISYDTNNVAELDPGVAVPTNLTGGIDGFGGTLTASADASGRLTFTFQKASWDGSALLEFITDGTPAEDFAIVAGIDTAAAQGAQTKLYDGPIARRYTVGSAPLRYDRLVMRSRLLPGEGSLSSFHSVGQTGITVQGVADKDFIGLVSQQTADAGHSATIQPATLLALIGLSGGQATGGQPAVTFYDGSGTIAANNVLKFTMDGVSVTVVFTASATGTLTPIGPASTAGTVINQIAAAMASAGFGGGVTATVISDGLIRQEGAGFRLTSARTDAFSNIAIGQGNANVTLGLSGGASILRESVDVRVLASALMGHAPSGAFTDFILDYENPPAGYFSAEALAGLVEDNVGGEYLFLQSQSTGVASSVSWDTPTADSILLPGTLLLAESGDGAVGEEGVSGFFVTSSDPSDGSGTANTSVFNSGTGQDGLVGQTYRDTVTGLTFTVLPREGGLDYPDGGTFTFTVSSTFTTDGNIPTNAIPGVELLVTNTAGVVTGDTAVATTYERGGSEPAVGSLFYVTYTYLKQDFTQRLFTRLSTVEQNFGEVSPNNPLSLASYVAFINGAVSVGIKQVQKDEGEQTASVEKFCEALVDLESDFEGGISPDILIPLRGNVGETDFWQELSLHLDVQSSIRRRNERTAMIGFSPVAQPNAVGTLAQQISSTRMRFIYPDSTTLTLSDALGNTEEFLVEGFYLAAALAGSVVTPTLDVATPWTNRPVRGFDRLGRNLDPVSANQLAQQGVTVIVEQAPNLVVRHGLTTDMTNVLTRTPTVILIADEVQQRARRVLGPFIGQKNLPGLTVTIEGRITKMLQDLVSESVLATFAGVVAEPDPTDPTAIVVEAAYQPIFPLLYIVLTFNLRASGL